MKGIVIKSTGNQCKVLSKDQNIYDCKIKGKTRLKNIDFTNPISVGDQVDFFFDEKNQVGLIESIHERKNYFIRKSVNLSHKSQIIAANIDLVLLVVTIAHPPTSLAFIDRILVQSAAYGIETKLIINKIDLHNEKSQFIKNTYLKIYKDIGYDIIEASVSMKKNIDKIKEITTNKVTALVGHSGVGKSSIINTLEPSLNIKINEISEYHQQGVHTTTYGEMHPLKYGGYIIDTPGIKGLGLIDLKINSLSKYFPEMLLRRSDCKFSNCLHIREPKCAILNALNNGVISSSRYNNYLSMLKENTNYRKNDFI